MKRVEKITERKARAQRRIQKKRDEMSEILSLIRGDDVSIALARHKVKHGSYPFFEDSTSPTGRSQVCTMGGKCEFPCNGDC